MIRLQERTVELYSAPTGSVPSRLRHFVGWLESEPFFSATLASLPDLGVDGETWLSEHVKPRHDVDFSRDEEEAVAACWLVARAVAADDDPNHRMFYISHNYADVHDAASASRAFLEVFVDPLLVWLKERILTDDHVLHSLQRYAREAAWFRRDDLRAKWESDTQEATLDRDLRHHLFTDGIDFPFSQARGPSGIPDIVVPDDEARALPLEVKVYDPDRGRDAADVRSGFVQAIEYAHDYGRADAYLAIFDVTTEGLAIAGDDPAAHVPYVRSSGVTVFIVVVPIGAAGAASRRRRTRRETLDVRRSSPRAARPTRSKARRCAAVARTIPKRRGATPPALR